MLLETGDVKTAERYAREARERGFAVAHFEAALVLADIALSRGDTDGPRLAAEALSATEAIGYLCRPIRRRLEAKLLSQPELGQGPVRRR